MPRPPQVPTKHYKFRIRLSEELLLQAVQDTGDLIALHRKLSGSMYFPSSHYEIDGKNNYVSWDQIENGWHRLKSAADLLSAGVVSHILKSAKAQISAIFGSEAFTQKIHI